MMKRTLLALLALLAALLVPFCAHAAESDSGQLLEWLDARGANLLLDPLLGTTTIETPADRLLLLSGKSWGILNGRTKVSLTGVSWKGSELAITREGLDSLGRLLDPPADTGSGEWRISTIVIDPGHGGKDPGSVGRSGKGSTAKTLYEKQVTLQVGLRLRDLLQKKYPDIRIIMTRETDTFISLDDRTKKANAHARTKDQSVLFISIHTNASLSNKAKGYEVWYLPAATRRQVVKPGDYEVDASVVEVINDLKQEEISVDGYLLANSIQKHLGIAIGDQSPSRGLKEEEWYVVRNAFMPSVLVELGFITNPEEFALLSDKAYLNKLAEGIYNGVTAFVGEFRNTGR